MRARKGYYAAPDPAHSPALPPKNALGRLLENPLPMSGLGLRVAAAAAGPAEVGRVRIVTSLEIDGSQLTFDPQAGEFLDTIDVGYVVPGPDGKVVASNRETLNLRLQPDTRDAVLRDGVRYVTEFSLPAGRHHLRLAAVEHDRALQGSIGDDLDVPRESSAPIVMGQIVLTTTHAGVMPTVGTFPVIKALLPSAPTASRQFTAQDALAVLAHVHARQSTSAVADCSAIIRAEDGHDVVTSTDEHEMGDLVRNDGWNYLPRLPLRDLPVGRYTLTLSVQARGDDAHAARTVPFDIVK